MRIVLLHTDLRLYWPARLRAFRQHAEGEGWDFRVLELAGKGSPYAFSGEQATASEWWECLFPERGPEGISPSEARNAFLSRLDALQPDVVVACGGVAYQSGAGALYWGWKNRKPVILLDDARLCDVRRAGWVNRIKKRLYGQAGAMLVPSRAFLGDYRDWGFDEEQVFFGLDVVDNAFWSAKAGEARTGRAELRKELGLPERFFLGVGRQIEKKNWMGLLEAYRVSCSQQNASPWWGLVLVGDGPQRPVLERYAGDHGLSGVRFLPFLEPAALARYYALAGALVLPSTHGETWGLVVNEAMACGRPVLVSRQCGCAETLVRDGENGWGFDPCDSGELARLMARLQVLPQAQRGAMGEASKRYIEEWGLERFCEGLAGAARFCSKTEGRTPRRIIDGLLMRFWKGRYRPV